MSSSRNLGPSLEQGMTANSTDEKFTKIFKKASVEEDEMLRANCT